MAGDTVTTIFGGDDSTFQAAARKVQSAVAGLASFAPAMKFFHAAEAGAKGMHAATLQATAGVKGLESALAPLLGMATGLLGITGIFESLKKGVMAAAGAETAVFHFTAIAGGADKARSAIAELRKTGAETATGFGKLASGAESLMEVGLSADQAATTMGQLNKISLNSGKDLDGLADSYSRVLLKQDVTSKDLFRLAQAGVEGIAPIAEEFKNIERATIASDKAIDNEILHINQVYELTSKRAGAIDSFGSKIGLMQKSFEGWARSGGSAFGALVTQIGGVSDGGLGKMSGGFGKEFTEGLQEIETETGLSKNSLMEFMREGKFGYEELVQAATRFREEQHKSETQSLEAKKYQQEVDLLTQEKGLLTQVTDAVNKSTGKGGMFENLTAFFDTFEGKWQKVTYAINVGWKNFGDPLMQALKAPVDMLSGFLGGKGKELATQFGGFLGGQLQEIVGSLKEGTFWQTMQQKGEQAFGEVLKFVSIGVQGLGIVLDDVLAGPGMFKIIGGLTQLPVSAGQAFGQAVMQGASPARMLEHLDAAVNPIAQFAINKAHNDEFAKFTPAQQEDYHTRTKGHEKDWNKSIDVIDDIAGSQGIVDSVMASGSALQGIGTGVSEVSKQVMADFQKKLIVPDLGNMQGPDPYYSEANNAAKPGTATTTQPVASPAYKKEMMSFKSHDGKTRSYMTTVVGAPQASAGNASNAEMAPHLADMAKNIQRLLNIHEKAFA